MPANFFGVAYLSSMVVAYLVGWWLTLGVLLDITGAGIEPSSYLTRPAEQPNPEWVARYRALGIK